MSLVRRYAAAGLDEAARRSRRARMAVGALDETGQEKQGTATAGVKRQYMGCAGRVANGINTVHLSYVREKTGHALAGARQWIPAEHVEDPVKSLVTGLPLDLRFRTKGQLAIDILTTPTPTGCVRLRLRRRGLRQLHRAAGVPGGPRPGLRAARRLLFHAHARRRDQDDLRGRGEEAAEGQEEWEVRSAGQGSKGERWYAWAWLATASPRHSLLVRRHLQDRRAGLPLLLRARGPAASKARLIRAAGLRWPVEESFELGKGCFGLDQCQARLYTAILRHIVLVMAALAICAVTAAQLRDRTDAQAPPPARPGRHAARRPRPHPAHRPRDQAPARRRPPPPGTTRPRRPLAPMATPPPGTIPLVPQTRTPGTQLRPGQLAIGGCRTRAR